MDWDIEYWMTPWERLQCWVIYRLQELTHRRAGLFQLRVIKLQDRAARRKHPWRP